MKCVICGVKFNEYSKVAWDSKSRPYCAKHDNGSNEKDPMELAVEALQEKMK